MEYQYDNTNKWSILEFSKRILSNSLEEAIYPDTIDESFKGKGRLGQMVEKYFFGYDINSNQEADFSEAGIELKCTPLKELASGELAIKERLVCTKIDYTLDATIPFEQSHIYLKCLYMLILFYLHKQGVPVQQLKFIYSVLWRLPDKDLLIIKQDYEKIVSKIREGKAHELSEGDTTYLGACRKGQKGDKDQYYYLDGKMVEIPAPSRAFSLKPQYMRTILEFAKKTGGQGTFNTSALVEGYGPQLMTKEELSKQSFEDILINRFRPYYGMSYYQLCHALGLESSIAKSKYALIANEILTEKGVRGEDVTKSDEFVKSGIRIKTIRLLESGRPKEAMSFENIKYNEIIYEEDFYESRLYDIFSSRFLFIVFREKTVGGIKDFYLEKAMFWTMPYKDLHMAIPYWDNIKDNVSKGNIAPEYFYKISDHKLFHVRPKGKNASDLTESPQGIMVKKYCYWFNPEYIKSIVTTD